MFIELNQLLLQSRQFSREYWEDCGLIEAEEYLQQFQSNDWAILAEKLPFQPDYWRLNCIDVLKQQPTEQSITLLDKLPHDHNKTIAREACRTLNKLAHRCQPDQPYFSLLQQIDAEIAAEKKKTIFFHFLRRKQPKQSAI